MYVWAGRAAFNTMLLRASDLVIVFLQLLIFFHSTSNLYMHDAHINDKIIYWTNECLLLLLLLSITNNLIIIEYVYALELNCSVLFFFPGLLFFVRHKSVDTVSKSWGLCQPAIKSHRTSNTFNTIILMVFFSNELMRIVIIIINRYTIQALFFSYTINSHVTFVEIYY